MIWEVFSSSDGRSRIGGLLSDEPLSGVRAGRAVSDGMGKSQDVFGSHVWGLMEEAKAVSQLVSSKGAAVVLVSKVLRFPSGRPVSSVLCLFFGRPICFCTE